jgi:DegV family protein with EDD domain
MAIAIVTDSTSDIPYDLAGQFNIHIVPNLLMIADQTILDDQNFSRDDFYSQLPQMKSIPTTGTASVGTYLKLYNDLISQGTKQIISIHPAYRLSGILNAATTAAKEFDEKVTVIDSQQISLGLGFQSLEAAKAVKHGMSLGQVLAHILDVRQRIRLVAMLDTLEFLRRSGRVSWARAGLGSLLRIKPFVEVKDGEVQKLAETRTRGKGIERLIKLIRDLGPLERLAILHSHAEAEAHQILESLNLQTAYPPLVVNVTTVIGTHVGPNGLGFVALKK